CLRNPCLFVYVSQVTGGSVTVELGVSATLPCKLAGTLAKDETLEQISWQRLTKEKTKLDNFFTITATAIRFINGLEPDTRFEYAGRFSDHDGTLRLHNVSLKDEGTYTCILTFFPTGNKQTNIPLRVLGMVTLSVMYVERLVQILNVNAVKNWRMLLWDLLDIPYIL
uniref:Ig-like domain-containing protein n=1 Tax=Nothobranchius furzeri TaxID=105023 RepID=A0A8C6L7Y0_NOTFU